MPSKCKPAFYSSRTYSNNNKDNVAIINTYPTMKIISEILKIDFPNIMTSLRAKIVGIITGINKGMAIT
tara:strand:+ start:1016 stop:1222 length:207 start_codon:yes stop_codon:yes gene_type:complete